MPTIQSADIWKISNRFDGYGKEMLKLKIDTTKSFFMVQLTKR